MVGGGGLRLAEESSLRGPGTWAGGPGPGPGERLFAGLWKPGWLLLLLLSAVQISSDSTFLKVTGNLRELFGRLTDGRHVKIGQSGMSLFWVSFG